MYLSQPKSMRLNASPAPTPRLSVLVAATAGALIFLQPFFAAASQMIPVHAAGFQLGKNISVTDVTNTFQLALDNSNPAALPFSQSAVKLGSEPAQFGPNPKVP